MHVGDYFPMIRKLKISGNRTVDQAKVAELARSIEALGGDLLQPIVVDEDDNVLAGAHRIEAFRLLGKDSIPARVVSLKGLKAELARLDENLVRNDGIALERAQALKRRKEIYEHLHPTTKAGHAGAEKKHRPANENISFARDTAAKTGKSDRSVQQYVEVAEKLSPEAAEIIRPTETAEKITELMELAKLPPKEQVKIAKKVAATGEAVAKVVKKEAGDEINERFTPRPLITSLHKTYRFTIDVASHPKSPAARIIGHFWTKKNDGLKKSWKGKRVWCNPPFDDLPNWVKKAHEEVRENGCPLVVMLMPAVRTEQPFWQEFIEPYRDRLPVDGAKVTTRFLANRPRFGYPNDPEGDLSGSPEFGCVLVIWEAA